MKTKNNIEEKINTYVDWFLYECNEPREELRHILKLILSTEGKQKNDVIETLNETFKHKNKIK